MRAGRNPTGDSPDRRTIAWDRFWAEVHRPGNDRPGPFTRWAVPFFRSAGARNLIDLGCGPGRDLSFLLEEGFQVTGVDSSGTAVLLAEKNVPRLAPQTHAQARIVQANLLDFLVRLSPESVDGVHASSTYQGFSEEELTSLFDQVYRVLVPGGLHLWSVRSDAHPGRGEPETVPPNFPALGFVVPLRFFSREECDQRTGTRFERLAFVASEGSPTFYIADRKRRSP